MNIYQTPDVLLQMTQLHQKCSCVNKATNPAACALEKYIIFEKDHLRHQSLLS